MTTHTTDPTAPPTDAVPRRGLSELDEPERYRAFDDLQCLMPGVWDAMRQDLDDESVVVVPSVSLERTTASTGTLTQAMEERALFQVLLLRQPRLRMVYVSSMPVSEAILEYYLGLLPGVIPSHARSRLTMVSVGDATPTPLSAKLLARPRLLSQVRAHVPNPARSHLIFYNVTDLERDVALSLGLPLYGSDPRMAALGSKSGCRRIFEELGVRCPAGAEDLHSVDDIVTAVLGMRRKRPSLQEAIVKLNDGVSGSGNAMLDLRGLPEPGSPEEAASVTQRLQGLRPESDKISVADFLAAFERGGGIVEERIVGVQLTSPSVQMRAAPDGTVELLSTHDQLLGGPTGQAYLGCVFPADPAYAALITEPAMAVGQHLAGLGVLGRFAVDFVVVQDDSGTWTPYAIELNLRKGGTTHPFLTLQFLTNGTYDGRTGTYLTAGGVPKYLVATDHLEDERLKALSVADLFDLVATRGLHFDQSHEKGIVFHMISCLTECGRLGMTAVGDSPEDAWELYQRAQVLLLEEAERAAAERPLVR
jgi:pheganomycin biosynthesis PGM1-like protein